MAETFIVMNSVDNSFANSRYTDLKIENSILFATYKPDVKIDLEIAKQIVSQRLSFQNGNSYLNLVDARQLKSATKEARDYLAKHHEGIIASAILVKSAISNMIINMFITFSKPAVSVKAFHDKENALKWLSQFSLEKAI